MMVTVVEGSAVPSGRLGVRWHVKGSCGHRVVIEAPKGATAIVGWSYECALCPRDEPCTNCGALRSTHTRNRDNGGLDCPPRADGKVPVIAGYDIIGMDELNHCPITKDRVEWVDPSSLPPVGGLGTDE